MLQDLQTLRVLEFPAVLEILAGKTHWPPGRERMEALLPATSLDELQERQNDVAEAIRLLDEGYNPPLGGLEDVRPAIQQAQLGSSLEPEVLMQIREVAGVSRQVGRALKERADRFPRLADRGVVLIPFPKIESEVARCFGPDARMLDSASPKLRALREEIRSLEARMQRSLGAILRESDLAKMLQEPIITQRMGRHVVPVKSEYRSAFPGLVIDQSASGATLFMEPFSLVEQGNQLRSVRLAEKKEMEAILARLSALVGYHADELAMACDELGHFDFLCGLGRYAQDARAQLPEINQEGTIRLNQARHPLLRGHVIPISIEVGQGFDTLVVTGPNTGGKTVTLKCVGLSVLMGLSGCPVPCASGSSIPFLRAVWADIGDEQSIAQSLSTFSAHLTQILRILPAAGPETLVLLDELGAGTDPSEGGALGMALLEYLHGRGTRTVVTTHLSELKAFAAQTEGMENAAVEFDTRSLQPTYRVLMGVPGRSNALQIASQLGLPASVLRRARELLGQSHDEVEGLLDDLEQERETAHRLGQQLEQESSQVTRLRQEYEARLALVEQEKKEKLDEAARQAEKLLSEARDNVQGLLADFRKKLAALGQARKEALEESRRLARELAARLVSDSTDVEELSAEAARLVAEVAAERARVAPHEDPETPWEEEDLPTSTETPEPPRPELPPPDEVDEEVRADARALQMELNALVSELAPLRIKPTPAEGGPLEPGTTVYVRRFGQEGTVLTSKDDKVEVRVGAVRITVPRDECDPVETKSQGQVGHLPESRAATLSTRLDLRGLTADEALMEVDRYLDSASMAGAERVELIHGKGTGALRQAIQRHLKGHPMVLEHRLGEVHEGGWGVTVVRVKR
ncbi:MAG: hypothetical protein AMXMBFR33_09150 [Candidatus Xenobia bacterium]